MAVVGAGITRQYVSEVETGKVIPSESLMATLMEILERYNPDAPLEMLFDYVRIRFPTTDPKPVIEEVLKLKSLVVIHFKALYDVFRHRCTKSKEIYLYMKIEQIPDLNIIFMRKMGAYGAENTKLMQSFKKWIKANHLLNDESVILGIAQDNPSFVKPEDCRYDVALIVSDFNGISDSNIMRGVVKGGKYAVFKINHTAEAMQKAWKEIFNEVSREGHLLDATRPILERYAIQMINNHYCEICVPIQ